jgi:hypothetical protein
LLILLVVLLLAAVWTNSDWLFEESTEERSEEESEISLGERLDTLKDLPAIPLDRPYSAEDYSAQRNLFDFTKSPEQIAAERAREEQRRRQAELQRKKQQEQRKRQQARQERIERQERSQAKRQDRVPPPPDFKYTYVAYMSHLQGKEEALAVLVKGSGARDPKKENIRIVRNGEILDDDFVIKQIDLDNLVIGYTDDRYDGQTRRVELIPPRDDGRGGGRRGGGRRRR